MKKLLSVMLSIALFTITQAQVRSFPIIAGDTISTSASLDSVSKTFTASAGYSSVGIQVNATKVSGTVTCKAYIYSSIDGTGYVLTDSATAFANSAGLQSVLFAKTPAPYYYYKVMVRTVGTTASTEAVAVKIYYVLKRYN